MMVSTKIEYYMIKCAQHRLGGLPRIMQKQKFVRIRIISVIRVQSFFAMYSHARTVSAMIVKVGPTVPLEVKQLPSVTNKFFTSQH